MIAIEYTLPLYLRGSQNAREHWRARHNRVSAERTVARATTLREAYVTLTPEVCSKCRYVITITRHGSRRMDDDNLASCCKAVRDGIADALGIDDGDPRTEWRYAQAACKRKAELVTIRIEAQP
jgi:hypothetical protein